MWSPEWMKKSGRLSSMVAVGPHAAAALSMPQPCPAVSPDQTNDTEPRVAGAVRKRPICGSPAMPLPVDVLEPHAVENVLPGRQPSSSTFEVKSLSGSALAEAVPMMVLKSSAVEHSTRMRAAGRRGPRSPRSRPRRHPIESRRRSAADRRRGSDRVWRQCRARRRRGRGGANQPLPPVQALPGTNRHQAPRRIMTRVCPRNLNLAEGFTTGG